jgi:hypothetical protein
MPREDRYGSLSSAEALLTLFGKGAQGSGVYTPVNIETTDWETDVIAAGGTVSNARLQVVDTFISALKTASIWTKMDRVWLFAAENAGSALTDLVGGNAALAVNTPTFTADEGYAGNGTTSYVNTQLAPSGGTQYTLNSAHASAYNRTSRAAATTALFGSTDSTNSTDIFPRYGANLTLAEVNANNGTSYASTESAGFWLASRTGANTKSQYKNGSLLGTDAASAVVSRSTFSVYVCGQNASNSLAFASTDQIAAFTMGAGLNGTEVTALNNAVNAYMTSLGKNVY